MTAIKPKALRVITGTRRPAHETVDLPPVSLVPPQPFWLPNDEARAEWDRMAKILVNAKLLSEGDLPALGNYCALHGRLAEIWMAGATPPPSLIAQFVALGGSFGLAPAWRAKVKALDETDHTNPFEKHKT